LTERILEILAHNFNLELLEIQNLPFEPHKFRKKVLPPFPGVCEASIPFHEIHARTTIRFLLEQTKSNTELGVWRLSRACQKRISGQTDPHI
jgi:hypothetical protein